jgi:hypothetical protein
LAARIYQEPRSPTQSGRGRTGRWVLEFESKDRQRHDPTTGWIGSADTQQQVKLTFPTLEAATGYAIREGLSYEVKRGSEARLRLQAYADNFK